MFGVIRSFKGAFYGALGAAAALAVSRAYDKLIDDPLVRREALSGYVLKAERDALASRLSEEHRRARETAQALEEHRKRLSASQRAEKEAAEKLESEISENERLLEESGGACRLDQRAKHERMSRACQLCRQ